MTTTIARKELSDPTKPEAIYFYARTVRRSFLCGKDPVGGNDYEHRKGWIEERICFLVSVFGIDCIRLIGVCPQSAQSAYSSMNI